MRATRSQGACVCPEQPVPRLEAIGTEAGGLLGPCACPHEWMEPIFLAFALTPTATWVSTPSLVGGTRAPKPPILSLPLSARMVPAPFCPHEYVSQLRKVQSSACPPQRPASTSHWGSTHAAVSTKLRVGMGLVLLGGSCQELD